MTQTDQSSIQNEGPGTVSGVAWDICMNFRDKTEAGRKEGYYLRERQKAIEYAISEIENIIAKAVEEADRKARDEVILLCVQALDEANVPQEVHVPELVGDDLTKISVPIVEGGYWIDVHKALKYMREFTEAQLKQTPGEDRE